MSGSGVDTAAAAAAAAATPTGANLSTPDITGSWILADITAKHIVRIADITGGYNWCLFLWHCPV